MAPKVQIEARTLQARVLSGSCALLTGSGLVTGISLAYNIVVARFLGPTAFGHATAVYTLLILISAVTLSFQTVSAKVVAQQVSPSEKGAAYHGFHRSAWKSGIAVAVFLLLFRNAITSYLNLPGSMLVILLAIGVAFYVPLGSRRGYLQGACGFRQLATNLVLEGLVRLCGSILFVLAGYGVTGVIAANAASVSIAYFFAFPATPRRVAHEVRIPDAFREALQAIVFFVGQVIINNCDIVLVKHFFPPTPAGLYAAVALVGRVIFSFSWAVVNTMFPIVAGSHSRDRKNHTVLGTSLLLVFAIGSVLALGLRLAPATIWTTLFGSQFAMSGKYNLPYLLALYAATSCVYALSVVVIAYEMSYKIANTGWLQLAFSGILIAGIYRFHSSLQQVIDVQMVLMLALLLMVAVPFVASFFRSYGREEVITAPQEIRILRRVSEDEVIAEFLRNDGRSSAFDAYQEALAPLMENPDFANATQNAKRRALLFIRHGALWRELPKGTEWFEVQMDSMSLDRTRVFPRAQWRKLARGDYAIGEVAQRIASAASGKASEERFFSKIQDLRRWLPEEANPGAILLIGLDGTGPFTILDGNHRLVAATLTSSETLQKLRFFCGLSPKMAQCCWYRTNPSTLFRYGLNLLRHVVRDPEAEAQRLLSEPNLSAEGCTALSRQA
jgi:O-antigen/teichoic acid export membrane protein